MWYLCIICGILIFEYLIKNKIEKSPHLEGKYFFNNKIIINRSNNYGIAGGIFANIPILLRKTLTLLVSVMFAIYFVILLFGKKVSIFNKFIFAFILGGGLSNLLDRYIRGYVFDYFSFNLKKFKKFSTIVFNMADIFIFAGGILLILWQFLKRGRK